MKQQQPGLRGAGGQVAPRAGARIETLTSRSGRAAGLAGESPPARGRGLKHLRGGPKMKETESPPARGRGLKLLAGVVCDDELLMSPPARGRGVASG